MKKYTRSIASCLLTRKLHSLEKSLKPQTKHKQFLILTYNSNDNKDIYLNIYIYGMNIY